jgi:hypothetical protein
VSAGSGVDQNRDNWVVATYLGGATMQEIGDSLDPPVSRERVRQLLERNGIADDSTKRSRVDAARVIAACRAPGIASIPMAVARLQNVGYATVVDCVERLGLAPALERLFRLRKRQLTQTRFEEHRRRLIADYRALADRLGHVPSSSELHPRNGVQFYVVFFTYFASMRELREAAGLSTNDRRGNYRAIKTHCKRGHVLEGNRDNAGGCRDCRRFRQRKYRSNH